MTASTGQPSHDDDWIRLSEACRVANREKIARWCRDGLVSSRVGLRVLHTRCLDTGIEDLLTKENAVLDPSDWASNYLGNSNGLHWSNNEFVFSQSLRYGLNMSVDGGTLYRIQLRRSDLDLLLAAAPMKPKGRPKGVGFKQSDKPLVKEMCVGLANGTFSSRYEAARHFAPKAKGHSSEESKAKRLLNRLKDSE